MSTEAANWAQAHAQQSYAWATWMLAGVTLLLAVGSIVAARLAYVQFAKNKAREEARWFADLYDRFYGRESYKSVYAAFDGLDCELLKRLRATIAPSDDQGGSPSDDRDAELRLTEYLNFFEFVAWLEVEGQLRQKTLMALFSYPLARIKAQEGMRVYLEGNNYECLEQVLFRGTSSTRQ